MVDSLLILSCHCCPYCPAYLVLIVLPPSSAWMLLVLHPSLKDGHHELREKGRVGCGWD